MTDRGGTIITYDAAQAHDLRAAHVVALQLPVPATGLGAPDGSLESP